MDDKALFDALRWLDHWLISERVRRGGWLPDGFNEAGDPLELLQELSAEELWDVFRALVNTREPWPITEEFASYQDPLLQSIVLRKGLTDVSQLSPIERDHRLRLWRGDITTLAADAIVNAANSQLLGCWAPGHSCIDNAIHTFAGVQLRLACFDLMTAQGYAEQPGQAKVTSAYNLPSRFVLHTVGPIANGSATPQLAAVLGQCYRSCLDAAAEQGCATIAFCSISTGVFGYPIEQAAAVALAATREWLEDHPACPMIVIFNVFSERDEAVYRKLLEKL